MTSVKVFLLVLPVLLLAQTVRGTQETANEPSALTPAQIMKQYGQAVVLIEVLKGTAVEVSGTGFIVSSDGLIVTNYHVIREAFPGQVKLASGEIYDRIDVVEWDSRRDLAIIKIPGLNLPTVSLGDSDSVEIGEHVVVIGSPLKLEQTISDGLVSGTRFAGGHQLIQISAPISPGNSGSPVFNGRGEVIGIAFASIQGGQNLNFAVPINYAKGMLTSKARLPLKDFARAEGVLPQDTGLTEATERVEIFEIAKGREWWPPRAVVPDLENLNVKDARKGDLFVRVDANPTKGQYVQRDDGHVSFSDKDGGRQVTIEYKCRQRKVAVLQPVLASTHQELADDAYEILRSQFALYGYSVIPVEQVRAALLAAGINIEGVLYGDTQQLTPENMRSLAADLGARELVATWVGGSGATGYMSDTTGLSLAVVIYDGATGRPAFTKQLSGSGDSTFRSRASVRRGMLKKFVGQMLTGHLGELPEGLLTPEGTSP